MWRRNRYLPRVRTKREPEIVYGIGSGFYSDREVHAICTSEELAREAVRTMDADLYYVVKYPLIDEVPKRIVEYLIACYVPESKESLERSRVMREWVEPRLPQGATLSVHGESRSIPRAYFEEWTQEFDYWEGIDPMVQHLKECIVIDYGEEDKIGGYRQISVKGTNKERVHKTFGELKAMRQAEVEDI